MQYRQVFSFTDDNRCTSSVIHLLIDVGKAKETPESHKNHVGNKGGKKEARPNVPPHGRWHPAVVNAAWRHSSSLKLLYGHGVQNLLTGEGSFDHSFTFPDEGKVKCLKSQKVRPSQPPLLDEGTRRRSHWKTWDGKSASALNKGPTCVAGMDNYTAMCHLVLLVCYHGFLIN